MSIFHTFPLPCSWVLPIYSSTVDHPDYTHICQSMNLLDWSFEIKVNNKAAKDANKQKTS